MTEPSQQSSVSPICEEHEPFWDDLAWGTLRLLGLPDEYELTCNDMGCGSFFLGGIPIEQPGQDTGLQLLCKLWLQWISESGQELTIYANPKFKVTATEPSNAFIKQAKIAQGRWLFRFKSALSEGPFQRQRKQSKGLLRQLMFTGILLIRGRHVQPHEWPVLETPSPVNLIGQQFGRLTVLEMLPDGRCQCRCECGQLPVVRRSHLQSPTGTTSCGCRLRVMNERRERKKTRRCRS